MSIDELITALIAITKDYHRKQNEYLLKNLCRSSNLNVKHNLLLQELNQLLSHKGMSILLEQWALISTQSYNIKLSADQCIVRNVVSSKKSIVKITEECLSCTCKVFWHFDMICRHMLVVFDSDIDEFIEQLSSEKFDKSLPILIECVSDFKSRILKKDKKKIPINKTQSKWGLVAPRTNKATGRPRGRRGFLKFNKTKFDVTNLKSMAISKVKNAKNKLFSKRKPSTSPQISKSDSIKNVDSKADNTSKDLADLDFDISAAIQESNERHADEMLEKMALSKKLIKKPPAKKSKSIIKTNSDVYHLETLKPLKTKERHFYKDRYAITDVTLLGKTNWLSASQVSYGMKLIQELFPNFNILTASPFLNYKADKFSLDNLLIDEKGNHVIKDHTFFILHSLERHWVNGFYYLGNIDKILTFFTIGFVNKLWWRFRRMAFI